MIDPGAQAAGMPPMDPAMMAQMLGGGGDPMAGGMPPGMDPMGGMPAGAPPMGPDPAMGMQPAGGNPYPTTDPQFMAEALSQIVQMQQQDLARMPEDQHAALVGNPIFEGLANGAPMGPGAGQDGAALEMGGELPMPPGGY